MVYAQSIGPFNGLFGWIEKKLAFDALRRANIVTLRESSSLQIYPYKNVRLTAETVFLQPVIKLDHISMSDFFSRDNDKIVVGVTIHHIYYKHFFAKDVYIKLMSGIFNAIIQNYKSNILIIPMEDIYGSHGGDRSIAREIINHVNEKERIKIIEEDFTSMETANIISQTDVFIGTKTHSIVYALKTGAPLISISYQQKSSEFMRQFCVEDYSIDMGKLSINGFMNIFEKLILERNDIKKKLKKKYCAVKEMAEKNNILLRSLLENE
ncbi:MAG: polysaccharide pyruvyl transferase family protein [Bacteroidales bacterium]|jgi:colanic acid/amylovoran biosynthesis protein|nr:polysaccharide pyruvyl transferase family protein [Bacteroidales bacterium]